MVHNNNINDDINYIDINSLNIKINLNSLNSSNDECAFFTTYY